MYNYYSGYENYRRYGQPTPPQYNIASIPNDLPLLLSYGGKDSLSDVEDVKTLIGTLSEHDPDKLVLVYREEYAHLDFIFGVNAKEVVYDPLVAFFRLH